jgi:hypothetical protein
MALLLHGDDLAGLCQPVRQGPGSVPVAEIAPRSTTRAWPAPEAPPISQDIFGPLLPAVHGVPCYAIPARSAETRPRTSSTLCVTMACMDSSASKA